jgi:hypothetical protein
MARTATQPRALGCDFKDMGLQVRDARRVLAEDLHVPAPDKTGGTGDRRQDAGLPVATSLQQRGQPING